jgi:ankyrin repeat protein
MISSKSRRHWLSGLIAIISLGFSLASSAQQPPSAAEIARYEGLFKAVVERDHDYLEREIERSDNIDKRDSYARSALHVATYFGNHEAMRALVAAGAEANALEYDYYDIVTIAAVANDLASMKLALQLGCRPGNVTSRYEGTALIAAAHLGHVEIVETLIKAGAPLDHVNNLNWTALIESIVLGDGGERHTETLRLLVAAGADVSLADRAGRTPLTLARQQGYTRMMEILRLAGAE